MIPTLITAIIGLADKIFPSKTEQQKQEFTREMLELSKQFELAQAQIEVNKQEAANPSVFVAGARPFIMWICASAFAWNFVLQPILIFLLTVSGHPVHDLPVLSSSEIMTVLFGILGLGAYRSYERVKGVIPKGK